MISSPAISGLKVHALISSLKEQITRGVTVTIVTWEPDLYGFGDFLNYLQLEDMGVFTTHGYDPGVSEEKLEEIRAFGASLR